MTRPGPSVRPAEALVVTLDPAHIGGVQTLQRAVCAAMDSMGLRPHLAFARSGRRERLSLRPRRGEHEGRPTLSAGYVPTIEYLNYWTTAVALRRAVRSYSVVHVVGSFHSLSAIPILAGRPFVSWVATPFVDEIVSRRAGPAPSLSVRVNAAAAGMNQALERWTYSRARHVWALSGYTARRLAQTCGDGAPRFEVLRPPVDATRFRPEGPAWRPGRYLLGVGRIADERKNFVALVDSFAALAEQDHDLALVIAGPGAEGSLVERRAAEHGLAGRVHLPGALSPEDLPAAYRGAEAFVLVSRQEGLGLVLAEAQASGCACVVVRCGGAEELVDDGSTGLLVEQGDQAGLVGALARVGRDAELRRSLGAAARRRVLREATPAAFAERLRRVYAQVFGVADRA